MSIYIYSITSGLDFLNKYVVMMTKQMEILACNTTLLPLMEGTEGQWNNIRMEASLQVNCIESGASPQS